MNGMPTDDRRAAVSLGALRFWIFAIWLFYLVTTPLPSPTDVAMLEFAPPGVLAMPLQSIWHHPDSAILIRVINGLLLGCVAAAAVGLRPYPLFASAALVLLFAHQTLARSFGALNHPELALLYATIAIAFFPAADAWAWPRRAALPTGAYRGGLALVALASLMPYTASAAYRIAHHPWATFYSDASARLVQSTAIQYAYQPALTISPTSGMATMLNLTSPLATVIELAAPLALRWRSWRLFWILYAVAFHTIIGLTMRIWFWETMLLVPAVLLAVEHAERSRTQ